MKLKMLAIILGILPVVGCGPSMQVNYGDAKAVSAVSTDFGSSDLQAIAGTMVESLLTFPPIVEETSKRRPVLTVGQVKNKTMQHIDTESVTDSVRTKLIRSGKFRFIDRTTDSAAIDEIRTQQESGLVNQRKAIQFGSHIGADYILTSNISQIEQRNSDIKDVYYKFTMNLKNLRTGILEWAEEKEIRKTAVRSTFGM